LVVFLETGGAEDGDARADEVERAEALDELREDAEGAGEFRAAEPRALQEVTLIAGAGGLAPAVGAAAEGLGEAVVVFDGFRGHGEETRRTGRRSGLYRRLVVTQVECAVAGAA